MKQWAKFPAALQKLISFAGSLLNAPLIGAIIAAIIGLTPPLHRAVFNAPSDGGFLKAWLTSSVKNIGELFTSLQLVVVGAKLSSSLMKMKKGQKSGAVPLIPMFSIFFIRFILWPALAYFLCFFRGMCDLQLTSCSISITVIYLIASKTSWLVPDPVLWFVMPTGPPTTKLTALVDVSGVSQEEKMTISKFVTICYGISPIFCLAVVGSLKACLAVK